MVAVVVALGGCGSETSGEGAFDGPEPSSVAPTSAPPTTSPPTSTPPATTPPTGTDSPTSAPTTSPPATTPAQANADINICNGEFLRFSDLPYDGMADTDVAGPTKSQPEDIPAADLVCQWDVFDFVKGYRPPTPVEGDCRLGDLGCNMKDVIKNTQHLGEIFRNQRVIIVTLGYSNEPWEADPGDFSGNYQEAGRSIHYAQDEERCDFYFRYGDGSLLATLADSTEGRYGPSCNAAKTITTTLLQREPS